jgi:hypothetical protein
MKKLTLSILFTIFSIFLFAQTDITETIYIPDHPGYTYNARLVGVYQGDIEFAVGYGNPYNLHWLNKNKGMIYNTTYVRYGISKHLEFRFGLEFGSIPQDNIYGLSGFNIGFKCPIITDKPKFPDIAIIATTFIPQAGVEEIGGQFSHYAPNITLAIQKCYFDRLVLFGNVGIYYDGFDTKIQYNVSFAPYFFITDNWGIFIESASRFTGGWENEDWNNDKSLWLWDAGVVYYITPNLQWDFSFGTNYRTGMENAFVNTGICWRITK